MADFLNRRTRSRVQAMQLLHQGSFQATSLQTLIDEGRYVLEDPLEPYAKTIACNAYDKSYFTDMLISGVSENWDISRINPVDRCIMYVAVYEMFYNDSVPDSVAISEAVEIAKVYGTDDSSGFVNGLLGKISRIKEANPGKDLQELAHMFDDEGVNVTVNDQEVDLEDIDDLDEHDEDDEDDFDEEEGWGDVEHFDTKAFDEANRPWRNRPHAIKDWMLPKKETQDNSDYDEIIIFESGYGD